MSTLDAYLFSTEAEAETAQAAIVASALAVLSSAGNARVSGEGLLGRNAGTWLVTQDGRTERWADPRQVATGPRAGKWWIPYPSGQEIPDAILVAGCVGGIRASLAVADISTELS